MSSEFQAWCQERGITHLTGAPYHPATNRAAERLVQTFKQALKKSSLQEFLIQYRRTPLAFGYSPSKLLHGSQIRTKIDILLPSPAHTAQGKQARETTMSQTVAKLKHMYSVGTPCYTLYCGPRWDKDTSWVPAIVIKVHGSRSINVRVQHRGPTWRRHLDQLRPRYGVEYDMEPGWDISSSDTTHSHDVPYEPTPHYRPNTRMPQGTEYGPQNPRRSKRTCKPPQRLGYP